MVRIGLATDSMEFTPTPAYKADNGYDYSFENGNPFSDVIEEGSFSVSQGFSYGSDARTTTFKCSMSGTMAQMKAIEQYSHIAVYKDGALVFCGCNPTFSKKIPRGVGRDGKGESFVEASVTYEDYSAGFKDVAFSTDESFDLFYSSNDAIKVCDPDNPSKSLVHILFGYLDRNKAFSLHFGAMPSILKTTVVTYFSASYNDKVLSMLSDVFKQAGLAWYVSNRDIYVLDVLETLSGTAVNIPDIESGATKKGRSYVKLEIPEIRIATARIAEDMVVYDSGTMTLDGKDWAWSDPVYYPSKEKYVEASFSCARKEDGAKNGKDSDEREKRYFNFRDRNFYGNTGSVFGDSYGAFLDYFSRSSSGLKYRVRNTSLLKRDWRLRQNADVLLFKYSNAYRPKDADGNDVWNGKSEDCDYIFSQDMAQRYADALIYQKKTEAVYYEFYADATEDFPQGFPINSVVSLQGTDEDNPLLLITSRTDRNDPFGGYEYRAVPYDRKGVTLSESFVASNESLPASDEGFSMSISRELVDCLADGTPKDTTAIRITVTVTNRLFTPTLEIAGTAVDFTKVTEKVSTGDDTYEYVDTDDWIYDLDPTLGGADSCSVVAKAGTQSASRTIRKIVEGPDGAGTWFFKTTYIGTTAEIDALGESGGRSWERANLTGDDPRVKVGDSCYFGMTNTDTGRMDFVGGRCTTISTTAITCDEGLGVIRSGEDGAAGPQGPPGVDGTDGEDGISVSTKWQYLLKAGDSVPTMSDEQSWSDEVPNGWYMGWTYWTRLVTTSTKLDGSIVGVKRTSPMRYVSKNEAMKSSVEFEVSLDRPSYKFDRRTDASVSISVYATTYGFNADCVRFSWNNGEKTSSSTFTDTIAIAAVEDSTSFKCTLFYKAQTSDADWIEYSTRIFTISGKDMTEYDKNFGILEQDPSGEVYLDGDFYVKSVSDNSGKTDYLPMMLVHGAWTELSSFSQAPDAVGQMRDLLMSMDAKIPSSSVVFYGWFRNIAAQDAVVDNLFARNIRIPEEGGISGGAEGSDNFTISGTGKAQFKGAVLNDCDVSGTLTTTVLRTANEDIQESAIGLVDPTNPFDGINYYDMQDAVITASRNMVDDDLVSVSGGSVKYRGVVYPKALKRTSPKTYSNSASGSISWDAPSKGDSFVSKTYRILTLPFQGRVELDGRSTCTYKTNTTQSVTYYTYGWETASSTISCDSTGYSDDYVPSNPSVGETYYTYGAVQRNSYTTWGPWVEVSSNDGWTTSRPSGSTTTSSDGKTQTKTTYTNVTSSNGGYSFTKTVYERQKNELVVEYSQTEYRHTYTQYSKTGIAAGSDVLNTAVSRLEYSIDGGTTWTSYTAPFDANTNTVYVRQVFDAIPNGSYYITNPDGISVSAVPYYPWVGPPTIVDVSSSTSSSNLANGLYAIDSSGCARTIERTTISDPINLIPGNLTSDEFWIKKSDGTYAINIGPNTAGDTFGQSMPFYQRPKSPLFSTNLLTSTFKDLLIECSEYRAPEQRITTGSIVKITPSSIYVDRVSALNASYFYKKGSVFSATVTPLSDTKGVHTKSIFPDEDSVYDIGSANKKYNRIYVDNVIGHIGWGNIVGKPNVEFWKTVQDFDLTNLDENKWFPCVNKKFSLPTYTNSIILVYTGLRLSGVPSWSTHNEGFSAIMYIMDHGNRWGCIQRRPLLLEYNWAFCDKPPISYEQMERSSRPVIWLRGGGKYSIAMTAETPYDTYFLPITDSYTYYEQTVSPSTSCPSIWAADIWNVCNNAWLKGSAITGAVFN